MLVFAIVTIVGTGPRAFEWVTVFERESDEARKVGRFVPTYVILAYLPYFSTKSENMRVCAAHAGICAWVDVHLLAVAFALDINH